MMRYRNRIITSLGATYGATVGAIVIGLAAAIVFGSTLDFSFFIWVWMGAGTGAILGGFVVENGDDGDDFYGPRVSANSCYGILGTIFGAICGGIVALIIVGAGALSIPIGAALGATSIGILGAFRDGLTLSASSIFHAIKGFVGMVFLGAVSITFLFALSGTICGPSGGGECPNWPPLFAVGRLGAVISAAILGVFIGAAMGAAMAVTLAGAVYLKQLKT